MAQQLLVSTLALLLLVSCSEGVDRSAEPSTSRPRALGAPPAAPRVVPVSATYLGFRDRALAGKGLQGQPHFAAGPVRLVMLETMKDGVRGLLVGFADGNAHLYGADGRAMIGVGEHPPTIAAAHELTAQAAGYLSDMPRTSRPLAPTEGEARIIVVTGEGIYSIAATREALRERTHRGSPVFRAAYDLLNIMRRRQSGG